MLKKLAEALEVAAMRLSQDFFALSVKEHDFVLKALSVHFQFGLEASVLSLNSLRVVETSEPDDVALRG